jgi:hypothetical protein
LGYNHNLRHGGRVFHVQTEDSGAGYARLYTHLFFEGTILASKKQEYAPDSPEDAVRAMMQQLHKSMIKELKHGGHDPRISAFFAARGERAVVGEHPSPSVSAGAPTSVDAVVAEAQPELPAPVPPLPVPAPMQAAAAKPVVMVKPGAVRRPPVVLSSTSADGVVVRRNVVINVGGGEPPVNGTTRTRTAVPYSVRDATATPAPVPAAPVASKNGTPGPSKNGTPAPITNGAPAAAAVAAPAPQPLASSRELRMPWETPGPQRIQPPVIAAVADSPSAGTRLVRMPWDPPAPSEVDAFASDRIGDKSLDEVILEYLSDDLEAEER